MTPQQLATLKAATLSPKESRVITPDGREFRSFTVPGGFSGSPQ